MVFLKGLFAKVGGSKLGRFADLGMLSLPGVLVLEKFALTSMVRRSDFDNLGIMHIGVAVFA